MDHPRQSETGARGAKGSAALTLWRTQTTRRGRTETYRGSAEYGRTCHDKHVKRRHVLSNLPGHPKHAQPGSHVTSLCWGIGSFVRSGSVEWSVRHKRWKRSMRERYPEAGEGTFFRR